MKNSEVIKHINHAFEGMAKRRESYACVSFKEFEEPMTLDLFGGYHQAPFVRISMLLITRKKRNVKEYITKHSIKVLYRAADHKSPKGHFLIFPFNTPQEKIDIVNCMKENNILPTPKEWSEAKSLLNSPDMAVAIAGCDYENAVTENAKAYLEKQGNPS